MSQHELQTFLATWDHEARQTEKLLAALPEGQYDFRPEPGTRSIGEMAWHLGWGAPRSTTGSITADSWR